jgi:hypothetical protein
MNEEIIELTLILQYQMEKMTNKELASFMQGKVLRYDNKLYRYQEDDNVIISEQHEVNQEQT